MKLKDFFIATVRAGYDVEIYYDEIELFGYKVNGIDYSDLSNQASNGIAYKVLFEIHSVFMDESNIHDLEGNTTYNIKKDGTCHKKAYYFDRRSDFHTIWIEDNNTTFNFGDIDIPIHSIYIEKNFKEFVVDNEKEIRKYISDGLFKNFLGFYKNLLNQFENVSVDLTLESDENGNIMSDVEDIIGFYETSENFTLMNVSELNFKKDELSELLVQFDIDINDKSKIIG